MNELEQIIYDHAIKNFQGDKRFEKGYGDTIVKNFNYWSKYPVNHIYRKEYDSVLGVRKSEAKREYK